ncbi:MAG: cysteine synthase [Thermoanaerobacteraceae bacterium]|jgi:cysteine synthase A|nr:cysteine synthase [Thermoanaerobacteraceae bacterium]MDN5302524.1 cysteine synthase [Thermoanaerobacteraceae bacterium]MDN5312802.1 cysteine synthase [Thermoanaerobacteraceae bacterium]
MSKVVNDIRELIGQTPILKINNFSLPEGVNIYAKLEYFNPGGSVKDRIGNFMLEAAEKQGLIKKGGTVIEPTAGNTGIGIALAALNRGYRVIFVIPEKFSVEKQELMKALGAEIIHTPTDKGMEGAIEKAKDLAENIEGSFIPNQFENMANPLAHYKTTGPEIYKQLDGKIDYFVAGVGSGGTFTGTARFLKERDSKIKAVAVEPVGSILGGGPKGPHKTEGIGVDFIPKTLDVKLIDKVVTVSDEDAFNMVKELAKKEGVLVGSSSGAAFYATLQIAGELTSPANIVTIFPDGSERYLSKKIYQGGI